MLRVLLGVLTLANGALLLGTKCKTPVCTAPAPDAPPGYMSKNFGTEIMPLKSSEKEEYISLGAFPDVGKDGLWGNFLFCSEMTEFAYKNSAAPEIRDSAPEGATTCENAQYCVKHVYCTRATEEYTKKDGTYSRKRNLEDAEKVATCSCEHIEVIKFGDLSDWGSD